MSYQQYRTTGYTTFGYPPRSYPSPTDYGSDHLDLTPENVAVGYTSEYDMEPFDGFPGEYTSNIPRPSHDETAHYLRRTLGIPPHIPVNLWAIPDGRKVTTSEMIRLAIFGSQEKRLTQAQICEAIEARYPHKANLDDKPWRRTVRHHLSLKKMFEREPRPADHPGKGDYWVLNVRHGEATRPKPARTSEEEPTSSDSSTAASPSPRPGFYDMPYKTESPRPAALHFNPNHPVGADRGNHTTLHGRGGSSSRHPQQGSGLMHGYTQAPHSTINPMLTVGDYRSNEIRLGPTVQPLVRRDAPGGDSVQATVRQPAQAMPQRRHTYAHNNYGGAL